MTKNSVRSIPPASVNSSQIGIPRKEGKRTLTMVLSVVIVLLVLGVLVLAVGVYRYHWRTPVVKGVVRVVPLPVAIVNGQWLLYYDFLDAYDTLDYAYSQPEVLQASGLTKRPSADELELIVLDRMVKDRIVQQLAARQQVVVSPAAIDAEMKKLVEQSGSAADVEQKIRSLYRWDLASFQRRVVEPFLVRQRLQERIAADDNLNADQRKKAETLLARVQSGKEDFQVIALEVNEDVTKNTDGDLGVFARGERDLALEQAAFSLEVGTTSEIVRTSQGFHILKLLEKLPADDKSGQEERVHLAHIFVSAKPLDQWLFEQSKQQRVAILFSGLRWDGDTARVSSSDGE